MTKRLITICAFIMHLTASGQELLTLQDAITKALQHNFDIRIADVTAQQAVANNTLGNAGLLPNVNAAAGLNLGSANTRSEFADGRVQQVDNANSVGYNSSLTLSYTLFAGGRALLLKKELAALEKIGATQLRNQIQAIVSQTIQAYAAAVLQQQQSVAIDTGLALAKTRMILSQMKYETGASAKVDFLQARVDYNSRQSDSLTQLSSQNAAIAVLNELMGEDIYKWHMVEDSLTLNTDLTPREKEYIDDVNLTLSAARQSADVSRLNARVAKTYFFPTLNLNGGYSYSRTESQAGFALFSQSYGPTGGLSLSVPVFQGGNIRRNAKVASLQAFKDELTYEKQHTSVHRQYRIAWRDYRMSVAAYRLEQENIGYAKENLDIQKARFQVGIATTLEMREAEDSYVQALLRLYNACYNVKVNETKVLELESNLVQ